MISQLPFLGNYIPVIIVCNLIVWSLFFFKIKLSKSYQTLLFFLGFGAVLITFKSFKGLLPGLNLLSLFVSIKFNEIQSKRDSIIYVGFSFILLIVNLMVEDKLFYILILLIQWIYSFHLFQILNFENSMAMSMRRILAPLFLALPITIILFIAFPRIGVGSLNFQDASSMKLGFTEKLTPGDVSSAVKVREVIFRASFLDQKEPQFSELYWIGSYLTKNDGLTWTPDNFGRQKQRGIGKEFLYRLDYEDSKRFPLFYLEGSYQFKTLGTARIKTKLNGSMSVDPIKGQRPSIEVVKGKRDSYDYTDKVLQRYLQLEQSKISDRLRTFSNRFHGENLDEVRDKIYEYFSDGFTYTLNPGTYDTTEGIEEFLMDRKIGFCGHFASAMAILLRMNGIPSRVVAGFMGGTFNEYGNYYIVTSEDSHAWVEGYEKGRGWVRLDPTAIVARERIEYGGAEFLYALLNELGTDYFKNRKGLGYFQKFQMAYDVVYYNLSNAFFNFDLERQFDLFKKYFGRSNPLIFMIGLTLTFFVLGPIFFFFYIRFKGRQKISEVDRLFKKVCQSWGEYPYSFEGPQDFLKRVISKPHAVDFLENYQLIKYDPRCSDEVFYNYKAIAKNILA